MKQRVPISAGAVVLREIDGELKVALTREKDTGTYTIAKGHVEPGETLEQTARREIYEVSGLSNIQFISYLGAVFNEKFDENGKPYRKTVHYYLAYALGDDLAPTPLWSHLYSTVNWFSLQEALALLGKKAEIDFFQERLTPLLGQQREIKTISDKPTYGMGFTYDSHSLR